MIDLWEQNMHLNHIEFGLYDFKDHNHRNKVLIL
jgi:hypothetical protein